MHLRPVIVSSAPEMDQQREVTNEQEVGQDLNTPECNARQHNRKEERANRSECEHCERITAPLLCDGRHREARWGNTGCFESHGGAEGTATSGWRVRQARREGRSWGPRRLGTVTAGATEHRHFLGERSDRVTTLTAAHPPLRERP